MFLVEEKKSLNCVQTEDIKVKIVSVLSLFQLYVKWVAEI